MKQVCFFFFLLFSLQAFSQKVALKNNLVYDAHADTQIFLWSSPWGRNGLWIPKWV